MSETISPHCPPDTPRTTPAFAIGGLPRLEALPLSRPEAPVSPAAWQASCQLVNGRVTLAQLRAALTLQCLSGDGVGSAATLHAFRLLTELEPLSP